jgi:hypothetical protein
MPSPGLSQLLASTLQELNSDVTDDIIGNNAIFKHLKVVKKTGGLTLTHPIHYAENKSFTWYQGWDALSTQTNEILTTAQFSWKQASINIQMSGLEEIQNAGDSQLIDLLETKIVNQKSTMRNRVSQALYSDGTGNGGKEIGGLQLVVADVPATGIVGGIDAATWSFWRNVSFDATTDGGTAANATNIQNYMDAVWVNLVSEDSSQKPSFILADNNYFRLYKQNLQAYQQITSGGSVQNLGMDLMFNGTPVYLDGGKGGYCPANHMYFLNENFLQLQIATGRDMTTPIGGERMPINQDGSITFYLFAGNLTCGSRDFQGVLKD